MPTNSYWQERLNKEKAWQKTVEANEQAFNKTLTGIYRNAVNSINTQIKADLGFSNGKLVNAKNMQEYEDLAKKAVEKAKQMRAKGKHVTRKDFSDDVNERLKIYNATMRINRNEMLKSKIGAQLVSLGIDEEEKLGSKLWTDYIAEKERQAGILGITAKSNLWTSKEVQEQIYGQIQNANFSKRIWANIDNLKASLDGIISTGIIRGDNPREMVADIVKHVSDKGVNARYAAERLARTETARVQFLAQKRSITDNGYKYVQWFAEAKACKVCREIADQDSDEGRGIYKVRDVPDIPVHPNCMCSIGAYWNDDKKEINNSSNKDLDAIMDGLQQSNFESLFGKDITNELAQKINSLQAPQKEMYIKHLKDIKFKERNTGGAFSSGRVVELTQEELQETNTENKFGLFFHETGHALDIRKELPKGVAPTLEDIKNPSQKVGLGDSLLQDFKKDVYGDLPEIDSLGKRPRRNAKAYPEWNKHFRELFEKRSEAENKFDKVIDKLDKLDSKTKANLSDMIESADTRLGDYKWSHSPLGGGHASKDPDYWKDNDIGNAESEFFAEVNSAVATNPESLKLIKQYFPISYKKYWEIVKIINS